MGKIASTKPAAPTVPEAVEPAAEAEVPAEIAPQPAATPARKAAVTSVTVKYRDHIGMETERTFSQEVHGDDFAKLAEEFKATNASKIIE